MVVEERPGRGHVTRLARRKARKESMRARHESDRTGPTFRAEAATRISLRESAVGQAWSMYPAGDALMASGT